MLWYDWWLRMVINSTCTEDVGPKFGTHVPDRGAGEYLNLLILERLSRKLDASCTLVKLC